MKSFKEQIEDVAVGFNKLLKMEDKINELAYLLYKCVKFGNTIYVIGNGGSAADASHFAGELLGRFKKERKGMSCISLAADNATITAIANDYGYEQIFSRQLEGLYKLGDVVLTLSTSGNSKNIIEANQYIAEINGTIINLLGKDGGKVLEIEGKYKFDFIVQSDDTPRIQEVHKFLLHYFADYIEEKMVNGK